MTETWVGWALASAGFAAATAVLAKAGLGPSIDSDLATLIRTAMILVLLALWVAALGKWQDLGVLPARSWGFLAASAAATGASWLCYFRALSMGPAAKVAPIDKLSVVLVAVFAVAFLGERPSLRDWAGLGLVTLGVVVLAAK